MSCHCPLLPWVQASSGPLELRLAAAKYMPEEAGAGAGCCRCARGRAKAVVLSPEGFINSPQAGILVGAPGEELNRIVIRFMGGSFSRLIYQKECIVGSGVILWLVSSLSRTSGALINFLLSISLIKVF